MDNYILKKKIKTFGFFGEIVLPLRNREIEILKSV